MFQIKTMNKISPKGLAHLDKALFEVADDYTNENAILVRSAKLHDYAFPQELLAIARAGAGVNNIPLDACAEKGIVVFNTPGANANAVKELAICALLLASRNILGGAEWVKAQAAEGADVAAVVEKGKAAFAGQEIMGKTLGLVGLGAIGILVANAAISLGMDVVGYDPFLSVSAAVKLDPRVKLVDSTALVYGMADYVSLHLPMNAETRGSLNKDTFAQMKDGVRIINMARGELVNNADMKEALASGKVAAYATDFPDSEITAVAGVIPIPHLGASSAESEENCAEMAAIEVQDYLLNGNIVNSVNMPNLTMPWQGDTRLAVIYKADSTAAADILAKVQATASATATRGAYGYMLVDMNGTTADISAVAGVIRSRIITKG